MISRLFLKTYFTTENLWSVVLVNRVYISATNYKHKQNKYISATEKNKNLFTPKLNLKLQYTEIMYFFFIWFLLVYIKTTIE